jgi:hypothetical protein
VKFFAIRPADCAVNAIEAAEPSDAYAELGLQVAHVDHGVVAHSPGLGGIAIVLDELALFAPPGEQRYFSIGNKLYAGNALLYGFDPQGRTCEFAPPPPVNFYANAEQVERAIHAGLLQRPHTSVNGKVTWQWPSHE